MLAQRVLRQAEEFDAYTKHMYFGSRRCIPSSSNKWCAPSQDAMKINFDVSLSEEGWVGLGVVARDSNDKVLFSAIKRVKAWWQPDIAEANAILMVVSCAKK